MKIALIIRRLHSRGGAVRQALSLARELKRRGHVAKLYAFSAAAEESFPEVLHNLEVKTLPPEKLRPVKGMLGILAEDRMAKELALLIDRDTELLNPHDWPGHHTAYYFKKLVKNVPAVWNVNELPFLRWPPEWEVRPDPKLHGVGVTKNPMLARLFYLLKNFYDRPFVRVQEAIAVLDGAHRIAVKKYLGRESFIAHSGVDLERFQYVERTPPGKSLRLLSSGIFLSYRRFEDAISAVKLLRDEGYDTALTIVGDYTTDKKYHQALKRLVAQCGLARCVTFAGKITDEGLATLLRSHHFFVFPHLQSQSLSAYEAMACGLPTVIARLPEAYETVVDGEHAIFVPPFEPRAIAAAVKKLASTPELYLKISRQGADLVSRRLSWSSYADEMINIYNHVLRR